MRRAFWLAAALLIAACEEPVQHGLDESSANEVVSALDHAGMNATKHRDEGGSEAGFMVSVGPNDSGRAMELLRSLGLPRGKHAGMAEMYSQPSLVPTATEERARFVEALGSEIERTLESIDGIVSARVHLVLAETDPLAADSRPRVPAQAAVLLKTRAGVGTPLKEIDVQRLVAGSVSGLAPASVAVVITSAPEWTGAGAPTMIAIGPVRMTPGSKMVVLGTFTALLGVIAVLALMLLYTGRRLAGVQRANAAIRRA